MICKDRPGNHAWPTRLGRIPEQKKESIIPFLLLCLPVSTLNTVISASAAKSLQSCPTLCDPIDGSPPGSTIPGILQARTPEWVTISFSNAWKWKVKVKSLSRVRLLATRWTAAHQAPPSMGFSKQEYWSGVPLSSLVTCYKIIIIIISNRHKMCWYN